MKKYPLRILLSVLVSALMLVLMYYKIEGRLQTLDVSYSFSLFFDTVFSTMSLVVVFLLMPFNLLSEALKWKIATLPLMRITISKAYQGVLAGITAGLFMPNRVGEFAGKSLVLPLAKFWKGTVLAIFTSMTQFMMTLIFGFVAIFYFGAELCRYFEFQIMALPQIIAAIGIIALLFVYFNIQLVARFFARWKKLHEVISVIETVRVFTKLKILGLSSLRYLIFAAQNLLMLNLLDVPVPLLDEFFLVALMYFILTAIPTIALTDLPARGSVMLFLFISWFELHGQSCPYALEAKIMMVSFSIWFINLIIPAIPGLYYLNKLSLLRKELK